MSKLHHDHAASMSRPVDYQKRWIMQAMKYLDKLNINGFSMLELGCGNGEFSELVNKKFGIDVTCLDYAEPHLERVRGLGFKTIKCNFDIDDDVESFNEQFRSRFDLVASLAVMEHIFDVDAFIASAHNVLKKNGLLLIHVPNISYYTYRLYSLFRGNVPPDEGHHIRFFSKTRLVQTLIVNGFDVIAEYSFGRKNAYVDRLVGEQKNSMRAIGIRTLLWMCRNFIRKSSSSYYSDLMLLSRKAGVYPIGMEPAFREKAYYNLPGDEKKKIIERLYPLRKQGFFDEHTVLKKFIDEEVKRQSHC